MQRLSREQMATRVARDIPEGAYVNLGIGLPTLVANHLPKDREVFLHSENGLLGMGPAPTPGDEDYDLINAGKQPVTLLPGGAYFHHADSFAMAVLLHGIGSTLVGLLYGAMLPMFPRRPIILGGLIAPVLWSGLLYSILNILNPLLASRIDWFWFIASQVAFGVVAGLVVVRQARVPTSENLPFAMRAGIEAPGIMEEKSPRDRSK